MVNQNPIHEYLQTHVHIDGSYVIQPDGTVDVDGNLESHHSSLHQLQVKFGTVTGNMNFSRMPLAHLHGFPHTVGGNVSVARTHIKSLEGAPTRVEGNFWAYGCKNLKTLVGGPHHVGKSFYAHQCKLTTLQGAPLYVGNVFDITQNPLASYDPVPQGCTQVNLPYNENAPVLKLLNYPLVHLTADGVTRDLEKVRAINTILHKYAGQGKTAMLNCALELKKAGYTENARW